MDRGAGLWGRALPWSPMTVFMLLTDEEDDVVLIACPSQEVAEEVGRAAIWSDGSVSAWLVEPQAITNTTTVIKRLREGHSVVGLGDLARRAVELILEPPAGA